MIWITLAVYVIGYYFALRTMLLWRTELGKIDNIDWGMALTFAFASWLVFIVGGKGMGLNAIRRGFFLRPKPESEDNFGLRLKMLAGSILLLDKEKS